MIKKRFLIPVVFLFFFIVIRAQEPFPAKGEVYNDAIIPKMEIEINPFYLIKILDPANADSDEHYPARFIFDDGFNRDTMENIGFRLRGNTSRTSKKKSFKISFNTFEPGRKYKGFEKLNINGEHNDPSVVRAKVCWDLLRDMRIPAPRANHVDLYINGSYFGLYINVEHIDENFVNTRFGNNDGNLYKCTWPADLAYKGANPDNYKHLNGDTRVYELSINEEIDDYSDLAHFIDVLNNTPIAELPCELDQILNVDGMIRAIAFDILSGNWDGPHYNKNNFYLYHNTFTGKFEYIPYDLDNTLGIDWLNRDWGTRNIYTWSKNDEPRPLYKNILQVPEYKNRLSYYLELFMEKYFEENYLFPYLDAFRAKLSPSAAADPYRPLDYGFTMTDFLNSYNTDIDENHVQYGIKPYITTRRNSAFGQLQPGNISPVIKDVNTVYQVKTNEFLLEAFIFDDEAISEVKCCYHYGNDNFNCIVLKDDGQSPDIKANDSLYTFSLLPETGAETIYFYIRAMDHTGKTYQFPYCGNNSVQLGSSLSDLYINEFMAENDHTIADNAGDFDDWVELYNDGSSPIFLGGLYMTDKHNNPGKWALPDIWIDPKAYVIFWADEESSEGPTHMNFKLAKEGEIIALYQKSDQNYTLIDSIHFGLQQKDRSFGRIGDGLDQWNFLDPTPGYTNNTVNTYYPGTSSMQIFPNPANDKLWLTCYIPFTEMTRLEIFDIYGRSKFIVNDGFTTGINQMEIPVKQFPNGIYLVRIQTGDQTITNKIMISH